MHTHWGTVGIKQKSQVWDNNLLNLSSPFRAAAAAAASIAPPAYACVDMGVKAETKMKKKRGEEEEEEEEEEEDRKVRYTTFSLQREFRENSGKI